MTVSPPSAEWRSGRMLWSEMPNLGTPQGGYKSLTREESLEDCDNRILWLERELTNWKAFRIAVAAP